MNAARFPLRMFKFKRFLSSQNLEKSAKDLLNEFSDMLFRHCPKGHPFSMLTDSRYSFCVDIAKNKM